MSDLKPEKHKLSSRSLRFRIIAMLLVCAAMVLLVNIGYSYVSQKELLYRELRQTADAISGRLAFTMSQPLWDFNKQNLEQLVLQELKNPDVLSVLEMAVDKDLLRLGRRKTRAEPEGIEPFNDHFEEPGGALHREKLIVYAGQTIGEVHVVLTDYHHRVQLRQLMAGQIVQAVIILLSISLLTYLGLSRILLKPLRELNQAAENYGKGDLNARITVRSQDEIGTLGISLNRMAEQIAEKISELHASKNNLQQSEEYRKQVFESSRVPIGIMDGDTYQLIDCNQAALEAFGYLTKEDLLGKTPADISPPEQYDGSLSSEGAARHIATVLQQGVEVFEWRHQRADGEVWEAEVHLMRFFVGERELLQFSLQDITERKRTTALMVQTEKMMMVGGLAAGVAHEINSPLGIITQTAQNIQRRFDPKLAANRAAAEQVGLDLERLQQYLDVRQINGFITSIREATERAARIIASMLKFSRKSESRTEFVTLDAVFDQVLELAASDYDLKKSYDFKRITILRELDPDLPAVPVSALEVEQVLLNLLKNAAQAMYEASTPAPQICLRTRRDHDFAVIEVEDNGPGTPLEVQKRIFEPFYTTKEVGKGTGLGLSVSYSIITNNHNGWLEVHSQPGNGTCFTIRLPLQRHATALQGASS